jgi:anaerobic selenocysteine-containing dehydrogenase
MSTQYPGPSRIHLSAFPPKERWDDWTELDSQAWPRRKERHYSLVPTTCFNCESACGLLAYIDKDTNQIQKFEGNPENPGSRGRNCAKGPATLNQVNDPDRILYPLKRSGKRGEGKWDRVSWDEVLDDLASRIRKAIVENRRQEIMYHVGRPGEDGFTERILAAWGVDGHNSHTNICSSGAREGYQLWMGLDRPSPDHSNAKVILLISAHLESGHYFNPHAQRVIDGKANGAKLIVMDTRLSNTATHADHYIAPYPGSEAAILLAIANYLIQHDLYNREFVRRWWNWQEYLGQKAESRRQKTENPSSPQSGEMFMDKQSPHDVSRLHRNDPHFDASGLGLGEDEKSINISHLRREVTGGAPAFRKQGTFEQFEQELKQLYAEYTFEFAAKESGVDAKTLEEIAKLVATAGTRFSSHNWRSATSGISHGWSVARCLFMLNALLGAVATEGGVFPNAWNKFVPKPIHTPPHPKMWGEINWPQEFPLSMHEMSFLLPHLLQEGRGKLDTYFTRVYNPVWTNPDGFAWIEALTDENLIGCHVALTPVWNETSYFADYILPMGLGPERHDIHSYETHDAQWLGFRQPVMRAARQRNGEDVSDTREVNPGEVWEENEFWMELTWRIDKDGSLGIRQFVESKKKPGTRLGVDEYYGWIFENSVPGLPQKAAKEKLTPLEFMRRYGSFEISKKVGPLYEQIVPPEELDDVREDRFGRIFTRAPKPASPNVVPVPSPDGDADGRRLVGVNIDGEIRRGFPTQSGKLEFFSRTIADWGWPECAIPTYIASHVHPENLEPDQTILISTFRLPIQIHTRSANAKWLNEIAHTNPLWLHTSHAAKLGVRTGDLVRVETEIGYFVVRAWVTEGIKPGIVACSHHMGRWKVHENGQRQLMATVKLDRDGTKWGLKRERGAGPYESSDADTLRIWWNDVGVHQNLTFPVHPDPISGMHCWHQVVRVRKAEPTDSYGDIHVDTAKSREVYKKWLAQTRPADRYSPNGERRPYWMLRPLKPAREFYKLPQRASTKP